MTTATTTIRITGPIALEAAEAAGLTLSRYHARDLLSADGLSVEAARAGNLALTYVDVELTEDELDELDRVVPGGDYEIGDDGGARALWRDGWIRPRLAEHMVTAASNADDDREALIARAVAHVSAQKCFTGYSHTDDSAGLGIAYYVEESAMLDLGHRLHGREDNAYSNWCGETESIEVEAADVARELFGLNVREPDLDKLRVEAGAHGDPVTVAAVNHCEAEIAEALAELWAERDAELAS